MTRRRAARRPVQQRRLATASCDGSRRGARLGAGEQVGAGEGTDKGRSAGGRLGPRKRRETERGEPVVRRALRAVLSELSRVGYGALRVEEVAQRARVHKTTLYRRWPTREALVRAALLSITEETVPASPPDTGSLRGDLGVLAEGIAALASSPEARTILRMVAGGEQGSELVVIARSIRESRELTARVVVERARARGELRADVDMTLFHEVFRAAVDRMLLGTERVDAAHLTAIIDLLLHGALDESVRRAGPRPL